VAIQWVDADVNVFGEKMVACGTHPGGCTYSSGDAGAHEVCVTRLPKGFSAKTGQGHWSDQYTGKPWCICIWAYSNYILHNNNPPLDCKSIPDKVLKERYSLAKFKQCGAMSSTKGCGPEDIRRSINTLCSSCAAQGDANGKKHLAGLCSELKKSAGGEEMALAEVVPEQDEVTELDSESTSAGHMATREQACKECKKDTKKMKKAACYSLRCNDGSGKYCWAPGKPSASSAVKC